MKLKDGKWYCSVCGAEVPSVVGMPAGTLIAEPGKPTIHVVSFNGEEVHRCEVARTPVRD